MKVTDKILSLPPYISTAWKNIVSLQMESRPFGHVLIIELTTGNKVEVPNLDGQAIEKIFTTHAEVLEHEESLKKIPQQNFSFPIPMMEGFPPILQHNPEQANTPPLPKEMLEKIAAMTKSLLPEDLSNMPKAEPHCHCPYCQIIGAVFGTEETIPSVEEEVTDADLTFRTWDIAQKGEKLFTVTNPLDTKEHYNVFLGEPIGCTCGQKNCEHIQAVLRT